METTRHTPAGLHPAAHHEGSAVRLQQHLSRWLMLYAMGAIMAGLSVGYPLREWAGRHTDGIGTLTTVAVFLVIYPMMVNLRVEALVRAGRNVRGLGLALVYNFVWAPLVGLVLVRVFLHDPLLALGFLLVMVVPCSSMSIAYTGLAKGDVELATVIVAFSFVVAVVAVPVWMMIFAAGYDVPVPLAAMMGSILTVLIAPMLAGWLTRKGIVRWRGAPVLSRLQPVFSAASMMAMFAIIFLIFLAKADMIVARWQTVLLLLIPNALFMAATLGLATWLNRRIGLSYGEHMAVVFASAGKNTATAIAIAATAFSPLVAVPAATMPIFQVMLMIGYVKMAPRVRHYYAHHHHARVAALSHDRPHLDGHR
jgi:ACR3 family arsenite efflux pump ArsB